MKRTLLKTKFVVAYRGSDIMDIAEEQGWADVRVCGNGRMITSPMQHESSWLLVPENQDDCIIPAAAKQRLKVLTEDYGATNQGLIIAHEPQPDLEPVPKKQRDPEYYRNLLRFSSKAILVVLAVFAVPLALLGVVAVIALALIGLVAAGALLLLGGVAYAALLVDPALIWVCDDGAWICLYTWLEEE